MKACANQEKTVSSIRGDVLQQLGQAPARIADDDLFERHLRGVGGGWGDRTERSDQPDQSDQSDDDSENELLHRGLVSLRSAAG